MENSISKKSSSVKHFASYRINFRGKIYQAKLTFPELLHILASFATMEKRQTREMP